MADLSDVENALVLFVASVLPNVSTYRGWPDAGALDAAMTAGQTHVTVWPDAGMYRVTNVPEPQEYVVAAPAPTLTVSISDATATFAGTCSADQIAGVRVGTTVWAVRCAETDTPDTVAVALTTLSGGTGTGAAVTLAGLADAKTGRDVTVASLTRWQEAGVRVIVWAPIPQDRDAASSALDAAFSAYERLPLPDGTQAIIRAGGTISSDKGEQANFYRRDLRLKVEYPTTLTATRTPVLWPGLTYASGSLRYGALHS